MQGTPTSVEIRSKDVGSILLTDVGFLLLLNSKRSFTPDKSGIGNVLTRNRQKLENVGMMNTTISLRRILELRRMWKVTIWTVFSWELPYQQ